MEAAKTKSLTLPNNWGTSEEEMFTIEKIGLEMKNRDKIRNF